MDLKKLLVCVLSVMPVAFAYANVSNSVKSKSKSVTNTVTKQMEQDPHYLESFSAHHRDAIEMAKLARDRAQDPELKRLAAKIIDDESKEIAQMDKLRQTYYPDYQAMEVQPKKTDLSQLEGVKGKEFDGRFARLMVQHHKDGIKMTNDLVPSLKNQEIKSFAQKMVSKQQDEINKLNQIVKKSESKS